MQGNQYLLIWLFKSVGGEYQDYITIDFARLMADELGGFVPPPNYP